MALVKANTRATATLLSRPAFEAQTVVALCVTNDLTPFFRAKQRS